MEGPFMAQEIVQRVESKATVLAPKGLGFGEGSISVKTQLDQPEVSGLTPEALEVGVDVIVNETARVILPVEVNDDGCGDGRPASVVYRMVPSGEDEGLQREVFNKSKRRAKVFGGGLVVAASMYRTVLGKQRLTSTVLEDRAEVATLLQKSGVEFGAHTDNHATGDATGCGAIDKYPIISANGLKYRDQIVATLRVVLDKEFDAYEEDINYVFATYQDLVDRSDVTFADAEGVKTKALLEKAGAVIKQLDDEHLEDFVVLNDIEGTTFDQRQFDRIMHERGIEGTAQAFAVDLWRGRMYADLIADRAAQEGYDREQSYRRAWVDFLVRTLATSATLTKGDQPVILCTKYELAA
ncbi:hypothetical protein CYG49_02000 [Candidatus Saccharibacteria bacterium]|nr:MAG: hypothetical protein CYG49_02000 [Candidatus Saccharibacteria bacterium]